MRASDLAGVGSHAVSMARTRPLTVLRRSTSRTADRSSAAPSRGGGRDRRAVATLNPRPLALPIPLLTLRLQSHRLRQSRK